MKKIFLTLVAIIFATGIFAQTGEGWKPVRNKQNFKDSTYFAKAPLYAPGAYESLSAIVPFLADTIEFATYSAGVGFDADSTLFAKGEDSFGAVKIKSDTTVIPNIDLLRISAGDSCKFNFYVGSYKTGVATDSLFTAPQSCGEDQISFTPNKRVKIYPGEDLWMGLRTDQPTGKRPKELALQVNRYKY